MTRYFLILIALMAMFACDDDWYYGPQEEEIDYWKDSQTFAGLEWSSLFFEDGTCELWDAYYFCGEIGGRLPTIDELRKIIINCPGSTYGGACRASDPDCMGEECWSEECHCDGSAGSYSALGDGDVWLWSSSIISSNLEYYFSYGHAWRVGFYDGNVNRRDVEHFRYQFRCVR